MSQTLKMTFGYGESDFTRQYAHEVADSLALDCKTKIKAINTSLAGGTAGGLSSFFISDDGEHNLTSIVSAQLESQTVTYLDLTSGGASSAQ